MVTPGDVGRPPAHLVQEFPQHCLLKPGCAYSRSRQDKDTRHKALQSFGGPGPGRVVQVFSLQGQPHRALWFWLLACLQSRLAKQLMQLPEVWWYQDPQQPNCALNQCWGSSEPQKARE
eukprot:scaffold61975_cov21-Tisochrysis_lutea.AAC.2